MIPKERINSIIRTGKKVRPKPYFNRITKEWFGIDKQGKWAKATKFSEFLFIIRGLWEGAKRE